MSDSKSSLTDKQRLIYNAMMILNGSGVTMYRNSVELKSGDFWGNAGVLAVELKKASELKRAREKLTSLQRHHTIEQARLQDTINKLQVK